MILVRMERADNEMGDVENGFKLLTHDTLCTEWRFASGLQVRNAVLQGTYTFYSFLKQVANFDDFGENGEG